MGTALGESPAWMIFLEEGLVHRKQGVDGVKVLRETFFYNAPDEVFGGADFHCSVEGESSLLDLLEDFDGVFGAIVVFEHFASERHTRNLDFAGE